MTTYAYDGHGTLAVTANADATVTFERDALGRVLAETVNGRTTRHTYDPAGRRTSRTTPSGHTSTWTYDAAGHPAGLDSPAGSIAFSHDAAGRETERRINDALRLTQRWDTADRLAGEAATLTGHGSADRILHSRNYAYREDGYLTEIQDLLDGTRSYNLDPKGRVTAVHGAAWTETYAYDAAGNLIHAATPADADGSVHREFTGTLVRRAGRTTYEHDSQGRLTRVTLRLLNGQKRIRTYTWNTDDRLTHTKSGGTTWRYQYDPLGRRTAKHQLAADGSAVARTDFTWDGNRLAEQTAAGHPTTAWDYAPGTHRPLAQTNRTETDIAFYAVVTDLVGTPTELLTATGDIAWHTAEPLWGSSAAPSASEAAVDCPLRFPGQYADEETGLRYNHHRYYDPTTARYLSPDPLGLLPADNDYAYAPNPTVWADPLGLACTTAIVELGKWDYFFGRVKQGSHNAPRSAQNLAQLTRVGIYDNPAGRQIMMDFFNDQISRPDNILKKYTDQYGSYEVRDGILAGPGGFVHVESTWEITDQGHRLKTIIPRGGG